MIIKEVGNYLKRLAEVLLQQLEQRVESTMVNPRSASWQKRRYLKLAKVLIHDLVLSAPLPELLERLKWNRYTIKKDKVWFIDIFCAISR